MTAPLRLRLSRASGFDLQAHSRAVNGLPAVNVTRPGPWGNPFVVGTHGTREECTRLFEAMASGLICVSVDSATADAQIAYREHARNHLEDLRGKNLACWCQLPKPGEPDHCHAAILIRWANQ